MCSPLEVFSAVLQRNAKLFKICLFVLVLVLLLERNEGFVVDCEMKHFGCRMKLVCVGRKDVNTTTLLLPKAVAGTGNRATTCNKSDSM